MPAQPSATAQPQGLAPEAQQRRSNLRLAWGLAGMVLSIFVVTLCTLRLG
ncbi:MAG: hypothetical protein ACT4NV_05610 [Rhodoferax sp.]